MFIGNGGGVLLAYDDGEFKVPGRDGRPKRIRFPAVVSQPAPEPNPILSQEPKVEEAADKQESLKNVIQEIESMEDVAPAEDGIKENETLEKDVTEKKTPDSGDDLF